ncbi:hypothetical protein GDO78_014298 [Eleutherodactylus coqui]|uniref:G-protein coupled receptors family 1 profile domain-containing protein n=1 Tax=Eleutherodactylus coqui TaxID=57060 RepID=A0A8J6B801_ELECQ|nr:hypothetical protein GDO78_014298 [Eleutherodactylus coqui]
MDNQTNLHTFHILLFSNELAYKPFIVTGFLLLYLTGLLLNLAIIIVIYRNIQLHTPLYLFLSNLSLLDIIYTTDTIPNLLYMLLSGEYTFTFSQCFTQMYFYWGSGSTEDCLLFIMAYDRYMAICRPLHYHQVFTRKCCIQLVAFIWLCGFLDAFLATFSASTLSFCYPYEMHRYVCDAKSFMKIACGNTIIFFTVIYIQLLLFGFSSFLCSLMSYIKIIGTILQIQSHDGRKKAFSTCSSHLIVLNMFYGTGLCVYLFTFPEYYKDVEVIFTVMYTAVTPALNPLVYSLQNKDVKRALKRLIWLK